MPLFTLWHLPVQDFVWVLSSQVKYSWMGLHAFTGNGNLPPLENALWIINRLKINSLFGKSVFFRTDSTIKHGCVCYTKSMRLHHGVLHEAMYFFFQLLTPTHYIKIAGMERSLCSLEHRDCNSSQSCCSPCRKEASSLSAPALPPTQGPEASIPRGLSHPWELGRLRSCGTHTWGIGKVLSYLPPHHKLAPMGGQVGWPGVTAYSWQIPCAAKPRGTM